MKRNHLEIEGRAFKVELKKTNGDMDILQFSLAFRNRKNKKTDEWENDWSRVVMYGGSAKDLSLDSGDDVLITGYLRVDKWTRSDGVKTETVCIVANQIEITKKKPSTTADAVKDYGEIPF